MKKIIASAFLVASLICLCLFSTSCLNISLDEPDTDTSVSEDYSNSESADLDLKEFPEPVSEVEAQSAAEHYIMLQMQEAYPDASIHMVGEFYEMQTEIIHDYEDILNCSVEESNIYYCSLHSDCYISRPISSVNGCPGNH